MSLKLFLAAAVTALAVPAFATDASTDAAGNVTYDLSNVYEPFLTKTDALIWRNRNLEDIIAMTAVNDGGWMSATPADGFFYNRTTNSVMVQLQADDGLCKTVRAYFAQVGTDIYGRADAAGYGESGQKYTELPASRFNLELATAPDKGAYGSCRLQAYGDAAGTVDALPADAPTITANGGTLQVNVSADTAVTNALAGTGGFMFTATREDLDRDLSYAWPSKTAATLVKDASVFDIEVLDAVMNGSWCGRHEGAKPYFVTTNAASKTITAQLQVRWWSSSGYWCVKAVGIELKQSGLDVTIRALWAATTNKDQEIGSDASQWDTWSVPVATSASANGYGLETISFKAHGAPCAVVSGSKAFANGLVVDGSRVILRGSQMPSRSVCVVRRGGKLVADAAGSWSSGYQNYSWSAFDGSQIAFFSALCCYQDTVLLDGSEASVANHSVYMRNLTLRNGSRITGTKMRVCLYVHANWTAEGTEECRILPKIGLCGQSGLVLTVDAKGPVAFLGGMEKDDGCASFRKKGDGTLRIAEVPWAFTAPFRMAGGKVKAEANVTAGAFVAEDAAEIAVDNGVSLAFADSSSEAWPIVGTDKTVNFIGEFPAGAQNVRFGTSAAALTRTQQRRLRINGKRAMLDESGYLREGTPGFALFFQ